MDNNKLIKFGTDGIRGIAGDWPINLIGAMKIGRGLGQYLKENKSTNKVLIGKDTRISGDLLSSSISTGLLANGVNVSSIGVIPTPGVAYLTKSLNFDFGIIISASHNPWEQNGIKLFNHLGRKLSDQQQSEIETQINNVHLDQPGSDFGQSNSNTTIVEQYIEHLVEHFQENEKLKELKIVVDCANGSASFIAPKCMKQLGIDVVTINDKPTGKNINVESGSEIVRSGISDLKTLVVEHSAHFGVAYDGDADRLIIVDENGSLVDGDHILYILAKHLNENGNLPKNTIVTTQMANSGLDSALKKLGIETIRTQVGDRYVFEKMTSNNYALGGEQSGHIIIYDEDHQTGDGIFTSLFIAHILTQNEEDSLSALTSPLQKFPQIISSAKVNSKIILEQIDEFTNAKKNAEKVLGENIILNARYSGTESLFRVMIEGNKKHTIKDITEHAVELSRIIQKANNNPNGWIEIKDCTTGQNIDIKSLNN